jgi:nucleoside-diphosphate-sugar epimerase
LKVEDNKHDLLDPAVNGTAGVLRSIQENNPTIKRVVITSSFASIIDIDQGTRPGYISSEKDVSIIFVQSHHLAFLIFGK